MTEGSDSAPKMAVQALLMNFIAASGIGSGVAFTFSSAGLIGSPNQDILRFTLFFSLTWGLTAAGSYLNREYDIVELPFIGSFGKALGVDFDSEKIFFYPSGARGVLV